MNASSYFNSLVEICEKYELKTLRKDIISARNTMEDEGARIAFIGPVKAGKSTLINALLEERLLPAQEIPTTGCITEIKRADSTTYTVVMDRITQETTEVDKETADEYILGKKNAELVVIGLPNKKMLIDCMRIVDTPGIGSTNPFHDLIVQEYLPQVDAAFVVMNGEFGAPTDEVIEFLSEEVIKQNLAKLYFVITRGDKFTGNQSHKVLESYRKQISKYVDHPRVFMTAAPFAYKNCEEVTSGIEGILSALDNEVFPRRDEILNQRILRELSIHRDHLKETLKDIRNNVDLSDSQIEKDISEVDANIKELGSAITSIQEKFEALRMSMSKTASETARTVAEVYANNDKEIAEDRSNEIFECLRNTLKYEARSNLDGIPDYVWSSSMPDMTDVSKGIDRIDNIVTASDKLATAALVIWIAPGLGPEVGTILGEGIEIAEVVASGVTALAGSVGLREEKAREIAERLGRKAEEYYDKKKEAIDSSKDKKAKEREEKSKKEDTTGLGSILTSAGKFIATINPIHIVAESIKPHLKRNYADLRIKRAVNIYVSKYIDFTQDFVNSILEGKMHALNSHRDSYRETVRRKQLKVKEGKTMMREISDDLESINAMEFK